MNNTSVISPIGVHQSRSKFIISLLISLYFSAFAFGFAIPATIDPSGLLLNNPMANCSLAISNNKNIDGINTIPTYLIGESMQLALSSNCPLFIYLYDVDNQGMVTLIPGIAGAMSHNAQLDGNSAVLLPEAGRSFEVVGPIGYERIMAIGTVFPLNPEQIAQFSSAINTAVHSPTSELLVELYVPGLLATDWVSDLTAFMVARNIVPQSVIPVEPVIAPPITEVIQQTVRQPVANTPFIVQTVQPISFPQALLPSTVLAMPAVQIPAAVAHTMPVNVPLVVRTVPGAMVYINNLPLGVAVNGIFNNSLPTGSYQLSVVKDGFPPFTTDVVLDVTSSNVFGVDLATASVTR